MAFRMMDAMLSDPRAFDVLVARIALVMVTSSCVNRFSLVLWVLFSLVVLLSVFLIEVAPIQKVCMRASLSSVKRAASDGKLGQISLMEIARMSQLLQCSCKSSFS